MGGTVEGKGYTCQGGAEILFFKYFSCGDRCGGDVHSPSGSARIRLLKKNTITLSNGVIPSIFFLIKTVSGDGWNG